MIFSEEQQEVIDSEGNIAINAVAGSGKTSTLVEYVAKRPKIKFLYLAFNKAVKIEALQKFQKAGINNIQVETAHSLAYKHYFLEKNLSLAKEGYRANDIRQILGFKYNDAITDIKFGKHVLELVKCFCNSPYKKVADVNYLQTLSESESKAFASKYHSDLVYQARRFLNEMEEGRIPIEHDFYLKKYQMSEPVLTFDCILFDEGQDASPVMLDIFLKQKASKVIVGDEHQQIYGWRYAVNALRNVSFSRKYLSASFRFNDHIAKLAANILDTKNILEETNVPKIRGRGGNQSIESRAVLGRTNAGILVDSIERLIDAKEVDSVYFEGNFNTYTYADESGSVYDVLNLYTGYRKGIKDPVVKGFKDFGELESYADDTSDAPLKGIIDIVKKYGKELPNLIKQIKAHHVSDNEKSKADIVYATVHKAKGQEYDEVTLLSDFLSEEKMKEYRDSPDITDYSRLLEDVNILYVAATRTKAKLNIPDRLVPEKFRIKSKTIDILKEVDENESENESSVLISSQELLDRMESTTNNNKSYTYEEVRKKHHDAYKKWTIDEDEELELMFCEGKKVSVLAHYFQRTNGAIRSRIKKLELREKYPDI